MERQDIEWLDQATHVIAEISGVSTGTGREIEYARTKGVLGKTPAKILCLYHNLSDEVFEEIKKFYMMFMSLIFQKKI